MRGATGAMETMPGISGIATPFLYWIRDRWLSASKAKSSRLLVKLCAKNKSGKAYEAELLLYDSDSSLAAIIPQPARNGRSV